MRSSGRSGARPPAGRSWRCSTGSGRRWALRVIWELRGDALTFRELQERCDGLHHGAWSAWSSELSLEPAGA